jgi:hypothetical protein
MFWKRRIEMKRYKTTAYFLGTFTMLALMWMLPALHTGQAAAQLNSTPHKANSDAVTVVNSPSQPIPVTGTTTVVGSVTIDSKTPLSVRDIDEPALQPFQQEIGINLADGIGEGEAPSAAVPAGKRFVVDFISAQASLPAGQHPLILVKAFVNGANNGVSHNLLTTLQSNFGGNDQWVASQPTRLYADPNTNLQIFFFRDATAGQASLFLKVSGHFVNVP